MISQVKRALDNGMEVQLSDNRPDAVSEHNLQPKHADVVMRRGS
jgi:hypothetical protein